MRLGAVEESLLVVVLSAVVSAFAAVRVVLVFVLSDDETIFVLLEILLVLVLGEVEIVEVLEVGLFAAASTAFRVVMGLLRMGETPVFVAVLLVVLSFAG